MGNIRSSQQQNDEQQLQQMMFNPMMQQHDPHTPALLQPSQQMQPAATVQFPDLNILFKSVPKMMQVADDMHRMADYIMDMRNMLLGMSAITMVGVCLFVVLRYLQSKRKTKRTQRHRNQRNSENSNDNDHLQGNEQFSHLLNRQVPITSSAMSTASPNAIPSQSQQFQHYRGSNTSAHRTSNTARAMPSADDRRWIQSVDLEKMLDATSRQTSEFTLTPTHLPMDEAIMMKVSEANGGLLSPPPIPCLHQQQQQQLQQQQQQFQMAVAKQQQKLFSNSSNTTSASAIVTSSANVVTTPNSVVTTEAVNGILLAQQQGNELPASGNSSDQQQQHIGMMDSDDDEGDAYRSANSQQQQQQQQHGLQQKGASRSKSITHIQHLNLINQQQLELQQRQNSSAGMLQPNGSVHASSPMKGKNRQILSLHLPSNIDAMQQYDQMWASDPYGGAFLPQK